MPAKRSSAVMSMVFATLIDRKRYERPNIERQKLAMSNKENNIPATMVGEV